MKKYTLYKYTALIKNPADIGTACTLFIDEEPELLAQFDTMEEAQNELNKYESYARRVEGWGCNFYEVTEYCIEIAEWDEGGNFVEGSDYDFKEWTFTE